MKSLSFKKWSVLKSFLPLLTLLALPVAADMAGASADGQVPSVEEIINRANLTSYYQGADGRSQVQMLITDKQGRKRQRSFTILRRDIP